MAKVLIQTRLSLIYLSQTHQPKPLLAIKDLSVDFHQGRHVTHAVKNISFTLNKGETLALVGESGSGKSVTALSVLKLLPYPSARHPSGKIFYHGKSGRDRGNLLDLDEKVMRQIRGDDIAMIFQEPLSSLNALHTVERQIGEMLQLHQQLRGKELRAKILELLENVGIRNAEKRLSSYPHQLSGGQRQRVMIAMALANNPDILIADEPTTAVDVTIQAQILELLKELQQRLNMSMLLITHDLKIVRKLAHRVAVMTKGEIVEQNETAELFANPQHPYTQKLLHSELLDTKPANNKPDDTIIKTDNLKVYFPLTRGILKRTYDYIKGVDGVSISLRSGQTIGIVGESGSGKTTFGFAVLRLISSEGLIAYHGQNINELSLSKMRPFRSKMQMVFQDPYGSLSPRLPVADIIGEGIKVHLPKVSRAERDDMVVAMLKEVNLDPDSRHRYPHEFSGGQRQRISIARSLVLNPDLIVLDEPTSALDMTIQQQIVKLLINLQEKYKLSYIFISHDLKVVRAISHNIMVMKNGKIVEHGPSEEVFNNPQQKYTQDLMAAALF